MSFENVNAGIIITEPEAPDGSLDNVNAGTIITLLVEDDGIVDLSANINASLGTSTATLSTGKMVTQQILGGRFSGNINNTTTLLGSFLYGISFPPGISPALYVNDIIPTEGTLKKLTIILTDAPGEGKSYIFTVMKNGVATDISVTISGEEIQGQDIFNSVNLSAGDYVLLRSIPNGEPTNVGIDVLIVWEPVVAGEYIFGGNSLSSIVYNDYIALPATINNPTEENVLSVIPLAGTVKKLAFQAQLAPGVGKSVVCTTRKNGADQTLVATVSGATDTQNIDAVHSFTVTEGDLICAKMSTTGGATNYRNAWSFVLIPDDVLSVPILGSFDSTLSQTGIEYGRISFTQWFQTASNLYNTLWYEEFSFLKIVVYLSAAPGTGKSRTITLRDDEVDTGLTVTVSDTNQTGSASVEVAVANLSLLNFKSVPTSTPALALLRLGFVYTFNGTNTIKLYYRTGATSEACAIASYEEYTGPFDSLGYAQLRVE